MLRRFQSISPSQLLGGVILLLPFAVVFSASTATTSEGFESGAKTSYASADVTLSSGVWNFNEALLGNLSTDRKTGAQSARIRYSGRVTMKFDRPNGAGTISIKHAKFGTDGNSTWQLYCSTNSGSSWSPIGALVTTSSTSLQTVTYSTNITGTVRCDVRKTDGTANRINIDDINITDYGDPAPSPSPTLPAGSVPFFDNTNNPVSGLAYGSPADVTPTTPVLNSFDTAVNQLCGEPGTVVSAASFKTMMNSYPTVLTNIKTAVGGYLVAGRTTDAQFLDDLSAIWFSPAKGFDHVFCGEPVQGGSIGGLHFVGRYLQLQNEGKAGRLDNNTSKEEVVPDTVYTMGVIMRIGSGTAQSPIKGYPYTLSAEEILSKASLGYKNNPNTSSTSIACHLSVTDDGRTFTTVFVRRDGGVRTFYPDATPSGNPNCVQ